ncbi:hypothetical protein [uncultured Campylobacter sp.]|nr:hypothetical protein [uncultured Campylobacter sp.]
MGFGLAAKFDPKRGGINLRAVLLNLTADERVLSGSLVKFGCR